MSHEVTYIIQADPTVFAGWAADRIWNNFKPVSKTTPIVYDGTDYTQYMEIVCVDMDRANTFLDSQPPEVTLRFLGELPHSLLAKTQIYSGVVGDDG